jgi:hypothetical protein
VAHFWPITLGAPHLDFEMWETMKFDQWVLVLADSGF